MRLRRRPVKMLCRTPMDSLVWTARFIFIQALLHRMHQNMWDAVAQNITFNCKLTKKKTSACLRPDAPYACSSLERCGTSWLKASLVKMNLRASKSGSHVTRQLGNQARQPGSQAGRQPAIHTPTYPLCHPDLGLTYVSDCVWHRGFQFLTGRTRSGDSCVLIQDPSRLIVLL